MECCTSVAFWAIGKVGELMAPYVHSELEFSFFYKKHLDKLKENVSRLEDAKNRLELSIQKDLDNHEKIHNDVQRWVNEVNEIIKDAKRIEQSEAQGDARCGHGLFPNLKLRHRLGKDAYKCELEVIKKLDSVARLGSVSYQPPLQCHIENEGYESFESRMQIFDEIRKALRNDANNIIGVWGMAGVGKTMLVKEVGKQALNENLFSKVIFKAVSQEPDYERIQQEIAAKLGLRLGDKTESCQRKIVDQKLEVRKEVDQKNEEAAKKEDKKKVLIILDDVWGKFDLNIVGIPFENGQARCKVILTSRSERVLPDDMDLTQYFPVGFLSDCEAMNFFNKIVRGKAEHSDFKAVAESIVKECACLPIAIHTVASALKSTSVYDWRDALRQLRDPVDMDIEGMSDRVFKSIQMSYDFLKSEDAQLLLLLCCLYEEDANIDVYHLLMHGLGWGLFKDHSLLLKGDYDWSIKVHDVVRDFGIQFAGLNKQIYCIRRDKEMKSWLDEKKSENSIAISLQYDGIKSLPQRLDCRKLRLFWAWKDRNLQLQDFFFEESKELKVLDLSSLSLRQLPSSLRYLDDLRTLRLSGCNLESVHLIGELKNLRILDFSRSNIVYVPEQIGQLTRLQLLDLHECDKLKTIHPGVLPKLTQLEELNMEDTFIEWEAEQDKGERKNNASLNDVMDSCELTALHLNISSAHIAPKDLFNGKVLERYDISVNVEPSWFGGGKRKKHALLTTKRCRLNLKGIHFLEYDFGMLLDSCEEMQLEGVDGLDCLVPAANTKGFPQLKHLTCEGAEIQYIINSVQHNSGSAFKLLETLKLVALKRLEQVCHGNLAPDSFSNLMVLHVDGCHKLRNLFSFPMAKQLSQLQILVVKDCAMIEEIMVHDRECSNETVTTIFPKLHTVWLLNLPALLTFCNFELTSSQRALPLFSGQRLAPSLRELKMQKCYSVKYLFSSSFAAMLSQLDQLELISCTTMEEIIMMDDEEMGVLRFPQLKYLMLHDLPKFVRFYSRPLQFPGLNVVKLYACPLLVTFVSNSLSTDISKPSEGDISTSKVSLFNDERFAPSLRELKIENCHSVKYLFSSSFAAMLSQLNRLEIERCGMMEEIIMMDNEEMGILQFPQLKYLVLVDLPKLVRFYSGPSLQFPELNVVKLRNCRLLVTFVSNSLSISEPSEGDIYPSKVSLFNEKLVAPNLTELQVWDCGSLSSLCSSFFAVKLEQLNELKVVNCSRMEEIIISMDEKIAKIEFHQLKHLILHSLPKLKRFWSGIPVQLPSSSNLITGTMIMISLFNDNVTFPRLESMSIVGIDQKVNVIWPNQQAADSFCQLKKVYLGSMNNATINNFLERIPPNLRCLETNECVMQDEVSLPFLDMEKSSLHSHTALVNSLLRLIIRNCEFKMALSPSTISSWKNVTFLLVHSCYGAENLLTYAAAQGLPQLKAMIIHNCKSMVQVIANEGGYKLTKGGENEIVFSQLELLVLISLPSLKTLYSGSYILRFPKLIHLGVIRCPNMINFSDHVTDTPQLKKLSLKHNDPELLLKDYLNREELDWIEDVARSRYSDFDLEDNILIEGNVNDTIQRLWEVGMGIALRRLFAETDDEKKIFIDEGSTDDSCTDDDEGDVIQRTQQQLLLPQRRQLLSIQMLQWQQILMKIQRDSFESKL